MTIPNVMMDRVSMSINYVMALKIVRISAMRKIAVGNIN